MRYPVIKENLLQFISFRWVIQFLYALLQDIHKNPFNFLNNSSVFKCINILMAATVIRYVVASANIADKVKSCGRVPPTSKAGKYWRVATTCLPPHPIYFTSSSSIAHRLEGVVDMIFYSSLQLQIEWNNKFFITQIL